MKFAIRDDDVNYFTQPEALERVYTGVWERCPVSLSVVPFHACSRSGAIPQEHWQGEGIFPVGDNVALVCYLREKIAAGQVHINQHGYAHRDYPTGYEFEAGEDLARKVREGKRYLEDLFEVAIDTFVPPHNALSRAGWEAVLPCYRHLLGPLPLDPRKRPWHPKNVPNFLRWRWFCLRQTGRWGPAVAYPFPLDYGRYHEFICTSLTPRVPLTRLQAGLRAARQVGGSFCLATHCWEFRDRQMAETFERFWDEVCLSAAGTTFVNTRALFGTADGTAVRRP